MTSSQDRDPEFVERLLRFEDEALSDGEFEAFAGELRGDLEKRASLIRHLRITQGLRAVGGKHAAEKTLEERLRAKVPVPTAIANPPEAEESQVIATSKRIRFVDFSDVGKSLLRIAAILVAGFTLWWAASGLFSNWEFPTAADQTSADNPSRSAAPDAGMARQNSSARERDGGDPEIFGVNPPMVVDAYERTPPSALSPGEPLVDETKTPSQESMSNGAEPVVLGSVRTLEGVAAAGWEEGVDIAAGEHSIQEGRMALRLSNGVRVSVEGPARFALESVDRVLLISGKLAAEAPPNVKGFCVEANSVRVIDLGTRFAVTANTLGDVAVHVFDGKVEAGVEGAVAVPQVIETGQTFRLNRSKAVLDPVAFDRLLFAEKPEWKGEIDLVSDNVRVLHQHPVSLMSDDFPGADPIVVKESAGTVLRRNTEVNLTTPRNLTLGGSSVEGNRTLRERAEKLGTEFFPNYKLEGTVAKGTKVSSYLVHFSHDTEGSGKSVRGFIRFDSPVMGIAFTEQLLRETDRYLGIPKTKYPSIETGAWRELENDDLELSEDGRTVWFRLQAVTRGDQIRILVAED